MSGNEFPYGKIEIEYLINHQGLSLARISSASHEIFPFSIEVLFVFYESTAERERYIGRRYKFI